MRHQKNCRSGSGGRCNCRPSYQADVWDKTTGTRTRRHFRTKAEARAWRQDAQVAIRHRGRQRPDDLTVRESAARLIDGMQKGVVRTRSGDPYKPSAIRAYDQALRTYILPEFGGARLTDLRRPDAQALVERLLGGGLSASTVRNAVMPLRVIYRRAVRDDEVESNPLTGLDMPASRGRRNRVASPDEALALIAALPFTEQALWATAFFAGPRRGELMALRLEAVDFDADAIHIDQAWDMKAGVILPKSRSSIRSVPIAPTLKGALLEQKLRCPWRGGLIFGRTAARPFDPSTVQARADRAWAGAGLRRVTLHEARHTFASLMIAAGVNPLAVKTMMGHSAISVTFDTYGHPLPGSPREAAKRIERLLHSPKTRTPGMAASKSSGEGQP